MALIIGIDPGVRGAICVIAGPQVEVFDMPISEKPGRGKIRNEIDAIALHAKLKLHMSWSDPPRFIVERVSTMPGRPGANGHDRTAPQQSGAGSFSLGDTVGCIRGVIGALGYKPRFVSPVQWKGYWGLLGKKDQKNLARLRATELYPALDHLFARVKDDGRAEALLLARWGWDQEVHR